MDNDELNEVGTLLHISSEIAQNHPKYSAIARAYSKRLEEINQEFIDAERPPAPTPPAEVRAAQHTTGQLSLQKESTDHTDEPQVERRV